MKLFEVNGKKNFKFVKVLLLILFCGLLAMKTIVFAENTTGYKYSRAATAGEYMVEPVCSLAYSSTYSYVCGGDVGTWFYYNNTGLPASYVRSSDRTCYFIVYEDDSGWFTTFRKYTGYFGTSNGFYRPVTYSNTYTKSSSIESDGMLELFMEFKVQKMTNDTSTAIPSGLIKYKYWAY